MWGRLDSANCAAGGVGRSAELAEESSANSAIFLRTPPVHYTEESLVNSCKMYWLFQSRNYKEKVMCAESLGARGG